MYGLTIDSILGFGENKGLTVKTVFQYCPEYIEWIMLETDYYFYILEKFALVDEPTPFYQDSNLAEYFMKKFNGFPNECLGHTYGYPNVRYAMAVAEKYNVVPAKYSEQSAIASTRTENIRKQRYLLELELSKLDPNSPKPEPYIPIIKSELFRFSDEALKYNDEKEEWERLEDEDSNLSSLDKDRQANDLSMSREGFNDAFENDGYNYWNID